VPSGWANLIDSIRISFLLSPLISSPSSRTRTSPSRRPASSAGVAGRTRAVRWPLPSG
jgi:hypothetical protein